MTNHRYNPDNRPRTTACGGYVDGDVVVTEHMAASVVVDCEACIAAEHHAGGRTLERDVLELRQRVDALERRLGVVGPRWRRSQWW